MGKMDVESLAMIVCQHCGSNELQEKSDGNFYCRYCNSTFKATPIKEDYAETLRSSIAHRNRLDFATASEFCLQILSNDKNNPTALWQMVLIDYQIVYMKDYDQNYKPIIIKYIDKPIKENKYYIQLLKNPKDIKNYEVEANKLQDLLDETKKQLDERALYDFFLCTKINKLGTELLSKNERIKTPDFSFALDEYYRLDKKGKKVFLSEKTLEAGVNNDSRIYAALHRSKALVVITSCKEHMETPWVKSEWLRFLNLIKCGKRNANSLVILGLDKFSEDDLPYELQQAKLQIYCYNTAGDFDRFRKHLDTFFTDYVVVPEMERKEIVGGQVAKKAAKVEINELEKREFGSVRVETVSIDEQTKIKTAQKFIDNDLFSNALSVYDSILKDNPHNVDALYGKILVLTKSNNEEQLMTNLVVNFDEVIFLLFQDAIKYSIKEKALKFINLMFDCGVYALSIKKEDIAIKYIENAVGYYDNPLRQKYLDKIITYAFDNNISNELVELVLKLINVEEVDKHIELMLKQANYNLKEGNFIIAEQYYRRILEINEGECKALKGLFKAINKINDPISYNANVCSIQSLEAFEKFLQFSPKNEFVKEIKELCYALIKYMDLDSQVHYKLFEDILKYLPKEDNAVIIELLHDLANKLTLVRKFEQTEKYYAMILAIDKSNYYAYFALLKAKLKCVNDDELIACEQDITKLPEFDNAIACGSHDDSFSNQLIKLVAAQANYKETKINELIKKAKAEEEELTREFNYHCKVENNILRSYNGIGLKLQIPEGINGIAKEAFKDCTTLEEIILPKSLKTIGLSAFENCYNLLKIDFGNVEQIHENAFKGCSRISHIELSETLKVISNYAFAGCNGLKTVIIPSKVEVLNATVFFACMNLQSIKIDESNQLYCSQDGVLFNKKQTELILLPCGRSGNYDVPKGVTTVKSYAFANSQLNNINLFKGLLYIEQDAFTNCYNCKNITIPNSVINIDSSSFNGWDINSINGLSLQTRLELEKERKNFDSKKLTVIHEKMNLNIKTIVALVLALLTITLTALTFFISPIILVVTWYHYAILGIIGFISVLLKGKKEISYKLSSIARIILYVLLMAVIIKMNIDIEKMRFAGNYIVGIPLIMSLILQFFETKRGKTLTRVIIGIITLIVIGEGFAAIITSGVFVSQILLIAAIVIGLYIVTGIIFNRLKMSYKGSGFAIILLFALVASTICNIRYYSIIAEYVNPTNSQNNIIRDIFIGYGITLLFCLPFKKALFYKNKNGIVNKVKGLFNKFKKG